MAETTANKVADFIVRFCHEHGDLITNLHLHKLVYYAQAWYLAWHEKPLFDEDFQAWISGPVQPELYERFKHYRWEPINEHPEVELPKEIEEHLLKVMEIYGQYNYLQLQPMVCEEDPWRRARRGTSRTEHSTAIIGQELMLKYYQYLLDKEDEKEEKIKTPESPKTAGRDIRETAKIG